MICVCIYVYRVNCIFCVCLQSHTILLVQPTKRPEGRTYADYESVNECMEGTLESISSFKAPGGSKWTWVAHWVDLDRRTSLILRRNM